VIDLARPRSASGRVCNDLAPLLLRDGVMSSSIRVEVRKTRGSICVIVAWLAFTPGCPLDDDYAIFDSESSRDGGAGATWSGGNGAAPPGGAPSGASGGAAGGAWNGAGGLGAPACGEPALPTGGACPPECTSCAGNACIITCTDCSATVSCPPGFDCEVQCTKKDACKDVTVLCPEGLACGLVCTQKDSCKGTTVKCQGGHCDVTCAVPQACDLGELACGIGGTCTCWSAGAQTGMAVTLCDGACACEGCPPAGDDDD
jgi:hypothetical protein